MALGKDQKLEGTVSPFRRFFRYGWGWSWTWRRWNTTSDCRRPEAVESHDPLKKKETKSSKQGFCRFVERIPGSFVYTELMGIYGGNKLVTRIWSHVFGKGIFPFAFEFFFGGGGVGFWCVPVAASGFHWMMAAISQCNKRNQAVGVM